MKDSVKVLLIEDSPSDARLVQAFLADPTLKGQFSCELTVDLDSALASDMSEVKVILMDLGLPDSRGLEGVRQVMRVSDAPLIVLSGQRDEELALQAVREGAQDYILKDDLEARHLERSISYAIERNELLEDLAAAKQKAETSSKAKSDFLAVMSHEFRTPLNGLLGCLNLIRSHDIKPEIQELLTTVESCAQGQLSLINDILDLSQIEAGKVDLICVRFYLSELIESVISAMNLAAKSKGVELSVHVNSDVSDVVQSDDRRLRQILFNLIGNALKFTNSGKVELLVEKADNEHLLFRVKDTGIGIPSDKLNLIFDEFTQVDSSPNRRFKGTGLGLTICKQLVYLLGGEIVAESEEGKGSTFSFMIRSKAGVVKSERIVAINEDSDNSFYERYPLSILVVEDSKAFRSLISKTFEDLGFQVDLALSGMSAVDMVETKQYDLILMDLNLPGMDGFEASAEIQSIYRSQCFPAKIVATTVFETPEMRLRCDAAGLLGFIPKPCAKDKLKSIIAKLFQPTATS